MPPQEAIEAKTADILPSFKRVLSDNASYEVKGILHSEMLLFLALVELLDVRHVIESGRARAQSTSIISRWLMEHRPDTRFDSVDYDPRSDDVTVANQRLQQIEFDANLVFGDSRKVVPSLLRKTRQPKLILIDGPKGIAAIDLALQALRDSTVRAVCVHDVHKDDERLRSLAERVWPAYFASDNETYVAKFSHLDEACWKEHQRHPDFVGWGPYRRGTKEMRSYGPTLLCLFNSSSSLDTLAAQKAVRLELIRDKFRKALAKLGN